MSSIAMSKHSARSHHQGGFSLIEILVAVLILSVGVLGVAGLQLLSLQNNTSAMYRTQAIHSAYDIIDRARANRGQNYSIAIDDNAPAEPDCVANACSAAQMRNFDLAQWRGALGANPPNGLPGGTGSIVMSNGAMTVTVRWQDQRNAAAAPLEITVTTAI